jgi:hypothetical protein
VPLVVVADVRHDGQHEVADHADPGCDPDRGPEDAEHERSRTGEQDEREKVEPLRRHADPFVAFHDLLAMAELPDRRSGEYGGEQGGDDRCGGSHEPI